MEITAASTADASGPVRLEPHRFRRGRDGVVALALLAAIAGCVAGAIVWGHAAFVLGAVYATMAGFVWLEAFRSAWAIGDDQIVCRCWTQWRTFEASDVEAVDVDPGEPGIDLSIGGPRLARVVVPLDDWRRRPGAVDRLTAFLTNAAGLGARVDPGVWPALSTGGRSPAGGESASDVVDHR